MRKLLVMFALFMLASAFGVSVRGQASETSPKDEDIAPTRVGGEVVAVEPAARRLTLKTNAGNVVTVLLDEKTAYLRVAPGEVTLEKAVTISPDQVGVGDRVIARGRVAADGKSVPARQVLLMSKADITLKREREREEWHRRGIAGRVAEVNPAQKEIIILTPTGAGEQRVTISVSEKVVMRRFGPGAVKFSDALPSSFEELKVGDQVRALGVKSSDGLRFDAEEVVSGSFRMVGGTVTGVNAAAGEVTINNLEGGGPLTVLITKDSMLRHVPPDLLALIRQKKEDGGAVAKSAQPAQGAAAPTSGGANTDVQELIERLPPRSISDLREGEMVVVSSTAGAEPSRVTAIILATGLESLVNRQQKTRAQPGIVSSNTSLGLPGGVLDGIGGP